MGSSPEVEVCLAKIVPERLREFDIGSVGDLRVAVYR